jgi:serine/threonine protein kinase
MSSELQSGKKSTGSVVVSGSVTDPGNSLPASSTGTVVDNNSGESLSDQPVLAFPLLPVSSLPPELAASTQYTDVRELGRGGMGVVYLANNTLLNRLEVLKVVNRLLLDTPDATERFVREIRSAAKLKHPNVVGAYSAQQLGDQLVFVMEYVSGQTWPNC